MKTLTLFTRSVLFERCYPSFYWGGNRRFYEWRRPPSVEPEAGGNNQLVSWLWWPWLYALKENHIVNHSCTRFKTYSETRLLRTLMGNENRCVLTKVRSIQNAIFLTGRTGSTCSRERSATEDASPYWMSFITRFSDARWLLSWHCELENVREIEIETETDDMLVIRKKEQKKGQNVLLEGKLVCNIRFCAAFCTSYQKKMYIFSDWRCPWSRSTERTL